MALSVTGDQIETTLRKLLPQRGYKLLNKPRTQGETGADIIAKKNHEEVFIECIGYQENPPLRSKQFYEGFFRSVSRLKDGATRCVLALPARFNKGRKLRAEQYGEAWTRIGNAFPELEIWPVSVKENTYYECKWNDWPKSPSGTVLSADAILQCTEESHLNRCNTNVRDIYNKIKKSFHETKGTIIFNPVKSYIGVVDGKNIAFIRARKDELTMLVLLAEGEVKRILTSRYHKITCHIDSYWHINKPNCDVQICDTEHFEEIENLIKEVVLRNQNPQN